MQARNLPLWKKLLFSLLLCCLLSTLLALLLEGGLRLAGFGASPHFARLVTADDGSRHWRENRDCTLPLFGRGLVRRPFPFRLDATKEKGEARIVILGSSAAMGDPEPSFSLARVLQLQLQAAYPGRRVTVINAAITAINSHVVRDLAADCAVLEPDVLVVYEGNNEVIGPYGPSGVLMPFLQSSPMVRTAAFLRSSRTGQLLTQSLARIRQHGDEKPADWGGMAMFLRQSIAADDPRLEAVQRLFGENLRAIARTGKAMGARTLVCTVPVNQRDFAPFLSVHKAGLGQERLARWQTLFDEGAAALARADKPGAEKAWRAALAIDDTHADLCYRLGRLLLESQAGDETAALLRKACDFDALRFRTDSRLNARIRELAGEDLPGLEVVDLEAALAQRSRSGIIGDEFLYEHVHLTLRGTHEAALSLLPSLHAELSRRGFPAPAETLSLDRLRQSLGFSLHEQAMIQQSLLGRFETAPFTGQSDKALRLASTRRRLTEALRLLATPEATQALEQVALAARTQNPGDWVLARNTGAMLLARGRAEAALTHLQEAQRLLPDDVDILLPLGLCLRALGRSQEAEQVLEQARRLEPDYPGLPPRTVDTSAPPS